MKHIFVVPRKSLAKNYGLQPNSAGFSREPSEHHVMHTSRGRCAAGASHHRSRSDHGILHARFVASWPVVRCL